ncbi:hypothetical protein LZ31DRAFT_553778 [Colletotrichum somersetense]|nr:hypothetical protein LZ31DRAFT_553778 [Colletotrichum somersetense]
MLSLKLWFHPPIAAAALYIILGCFVSEMPAYDIYFPFQLAGYYLVNHWDRWLVWFGSQEAPNPRQSLHSTVR